MQLLASPELTFTGRYFAPLGLGNLMNQRLPRPTLRLAWADLGCPVGAHSVLCCHLHNVAQGEREKEVGFTKGRAQRKTGASSRTLTRIAVTWGFLSSGMKPRWPLTPTSWPT